MCLCLYECGKQGCWGFCVREADVGQTEGLLTGSSDPSCRNGGELPHTLCWFIWELLLSEMSFKRMMARLPHSNNECLCSLEDESGEILKKSNLLHLNLNIHQLTAATSACSFLTISILVLHVQSELWPSQEQHNLWSCGFRPFSTTLTYCLTCWPQVRLLCHHSNKANTVVFQYFLR